MKSTIISIGSIALFSSLVTALPAGITARAAATVIIGIEGPDDTTTQHTIPLNAIVPSSKANPPFSDGVAASVGQAGIHCQAYSDAQGLKPLGGGEFNSTLFDLPLNGGGGQGTAATPDDTVPIGALCCAASVSDFAKFCVVAPPASQKPPPPPPATKTVTVTIVSNDDTALQIPIPTDGKPVENKTGLTNLVEAVIRDTDAKVTCQAFSDVKGTKKVGNPITDASTGSLGSNGKPVKVLAISCSSK